MPVLVGAVREKVEAPVTSDPWSAWYDQNRVAIFDRRRLVLPKTLPHPQVAGFRRTAFAESVGQVCDYVLPLPDGSRLHVHEFGDGTMKLHRDATDPARGVRFALWHWINESPSGRIVKYIGSSLLLFRVFVR